MVTFFSVPKPFSGLFSVIQRNAIESWVRLHPESEVILFGDETGVAEEARRLKIRHIPSIRKNRFGTPFMDDVFARARQAASFGALCFLNTDIVFLDRLTELVSPPPFERYLITGRRWDLQVDQPLDFRSEHWRQYLFGQMRSRGKLHAACGMDYFLFPRGLYGQIPPLVIGRLANDNWLIWRALSKRIPVLDATAAVRCVHQEHERTFDSIGRLSPGGENGFRQGPEARTNALLASGISEFCGLDEAGYKVTSERTWTKNRTAKHLRRKMLFSPFLTFERGLPAYLTKRLFLSFRKLKLI